MRWPRERPPQRRADPLAIAVLEHELLGIEPEPGTAAAFAVGLQSLKRCGISSRESVSPRPNGE